MSFGTYLADNLPLFCLAAAMLFISFSNINIRRKESLYFIIFTIIVLFLSASVFLENYAKEYGQIMLGTIFSSTGYIVRPMLLYIFVLMVNVNIPHKKSFYLLWLIPIMINTIIYTLPLFTDSEVVSHLVFYYQSDEAGKACFVRGSALNFFSHLISLLYLGYLFFVSIKKLPGIHRRDGIVIFLCISFILATVITEVFTSRNNLLNIICEICALVYYLFVTSTENREDDLTKLFDRRTFYEDCARFSRIINGVIQLDMNGLKYINDNFGHSVGDYALKKTSTVVSESLNDNMYLYRLSGDEFIALMLNGSEEQLNDAVDRIKNNMNGTDYSIAVGACFITQGTSIEEAMKIAESKMYEDKQKYYEKSGVERRKV